MRNKQITILATRLYRAFSPYILAIISIPVYILKYRKYHLVKRTEKGFADHIRQQPITTDRTITRLLNAYNKAKADQKRASKPYQVGHLWQEILDTRFSRLTTALRERDSGTVKSILENFNREDCGDDTCGGGQYYQRMKKVPFYKYQYISAWQRRYDVCKKELGREPTFDSKLLGNPVGVCQGDQVVTLCNIEYHYYADQIASLVGQVAHPVICEIGGGVGGQAYETIRHHTPNLSYILLDIPEVLLLSSYYLMMAFPDKKMMLYGESGNPTDYDIALLPNFFLPELTDSSVDVFFNSCSFSEMDYNTTKEYLRQIERVCRKYLMHINHNARLIWHEKGGKVTNMIAEEVVPDASLFRSVYRKPRLFSLLEDTFVIHWFYRAQYYQYLYERRYHDNIV